MAVGGTYLSKSYAILLVFILLSSTLAIALPAASTDPPPGSDGSRAPVGESSGKIVLAELVTAGWCLNCPSADGALEEMVAEYTRDEFVVLSYHRIDVLSNADSNARMAYYGNPYQPWVVFDGVIEVTGNKGSPTLNRAAYEPAYDTRSLVTPVVDVSVEGWTDTTTGHGSVWVNVTALETVSLPDLRVHTAVFEDDFGPWNGGNDVLYHHWVVRDLLAGSDGEALTIATGETKSLSYTFDASGYAQDLDQIGVVAFVQSNGSTREVLQTGFMKDHIASPANEPPELSSPVLTPEEGNTSTTFRYEVQYRDPDDEPAISAQLFIDDMPVDMTSYHTGPWTDWVTYHHETPLTVGDDHSYYFVFSDGMREVRLPDPATGPGFFTGPVVEPPSFAPTLTNGMVNPPVGDPLDTRTFSVVYTDGENDAPRVAQIVIDGVAHDMTGHGTDYTLGVTFTYSTTLTVGEHEYYFQFGDGIHGARLPANDTTVDSVVEDLQRIVVLCNSPEGDQTTTLDLVTFDFDEEGVAPGTIVGYLWESSLIGELSQERTFQRTLPEGLHNITVTVTTADGSTYSDWFVVLSYVPIAHAFISEVTVTPAMPIEGDQVMVTVTVGNDGDIGAEAIAVSALDGMGGDFDDLLLDGPIAPGETETATFTWQLGAGVHSFTIVVGTDQEAFSVNVEENLAPVADPEATNPDGDDHGFLVDEDISFVPGATDPEGEDLAYLWDFGDGTNSTQAEPTHSYGEDGTYTVTLTVTDPRGANFEDSFDLKVASGDDGDDGAIAGFGTVIALLALLIGLVTFVRFNKRW
jgi:hypothetical protein